MLTRPGSEPGPEWVRRPTGDARELRKAILGAFVFVGVIQVTAIVAGDIAVYRAHGGSRAIERCACAGTGVAFGGEAGGQQKESLFG